MSTTISMDRAGRVVLPKTVRDRLQLEPGESLELESFDDHIVLRPARERVLAEETRGLGFPDGRTSGSIGGGRYYLQGAG
jgi:AbrB family looped-hinge helix DNA binding protein